ncbi:hypothetical protein KHS38_07105 [Mucilaginibacter sp. Bleaf8]|uniref:FEKKY domain-containing protein n=1 Tax=Mucilaginibacter sp. Bleaf8 TaxID=2834430 RepID=UPI001BCD0E0C|nr:hypothetical protein [Mucilaginibacter sp. Bleaf8]MBS7564169.1 hypothetical protein [Mucilaginibacter sp. Bleaf8]
MKCSVSSLSVLVILALCLNLGCKPKNQKAAHGKAVSKADSTESTLFYTYGLPGPAESENATSVVAAKWGFGYKSVAGCTVSEKLVDSVQKHNEQVEEGLIKKYGKDWRARFNKEAATELAAHKRVIALLDKQKQNIHKRTELEKEGNELQYYISPAGKEQLYEAKAVGWAKINGKEAYVSYYKYIVDLNNATVKLVSDTITKI